MQICVSSIHLESPKCLEKSCKDGWMDGGRDGWMDGNPYCLQKMSKKIHPSIWLDLFLYLFVITSISSCSTSHKCHNTMTNDWFKQFGALAPHGVWSLDARTLARGIPLVELMFEQRQKNTLWWTYKKLLKMAIEIVDFPIKNGDFPLLC